MVSPVTVSGLTQTAVGALTGFPFAVAVDNPDLLKKVGIASPARLRQLHLDLVIMGGLVAGAGTALPDLPKKFAVPLALGGWTNALAFLPLAVNPALIKDPRFKAASFGSFVLTSVGWVGVAAHAWRRRRA